MMIPKRRTPQAIEEHGTARAKYARPVLRGMVLVVALCAFVAFLADFLYGGKWEALPIFVLASCALMVMTVKETVFAIEDEETVKERKYRLPNWSLIIYCLITGLGYNWVCAFLWFSRRYAFFSGPVIGVTSLILVLYAIMGFAVARLTGNWRTALLVFALAPCALGSIVLRLGLIR